MHAVYTEMETHLDQSAGPVRQLWQHHEAVLRRSDALAADLLDVGVDASTADVTSGTKQYMQGIRAAAEHHSGAGLLGHLYCRFSSR